MKKNIQRENERTGGVEWIVQETPENRQNYESLKFVKALKVNKRRRAQEKSTEKWLTVFVKGERGSRGVRKVR